MFVISDSSPLIALAQCGRLDLLDSLFGRVVIPAKVFEETQVIAGVVASLITAWSQGKIMTMNGTNLARAKALALDPGETEALALYWDTNADLLLIDELDGRQAALAAGIKITGTVGIFITAKQRGLVPAIRPLLDILRTLNFYISDNLYHRALSAEKE
ncbi:nucleic acid-binding protein [Spirochaetia bacterium]|nr:nucleic acid-binding protein [Spirochaetia bacterium]